MLGSFPRTLPGQISFTQGRWKKGILLNFKGTLISRMKSQTRLSHPPQCRHAEEEQCNFVSLSDAAFGSLNLFFSSIMKDGRRNREWYSADLRKDWIRISKALHSHDRNHWQVWGSLTVHYTHRQHNNSQLSAVQPLVLSNHFFRTWLSKRTSEQH